MGKFPLSIMMHYIVKEKVRECKHQRQFGEGDGRSLRAKLGKEKYVDAARPE
jgi:hypothetical protein